MLSKIICLLFLSLTCAAQNLSLFKDNFESSRTDFLNLTQPENQNFEWLNKDAKKLSVDYWFKPAKLKKQTLLIIISGIHGVEGYTGSAVQRLWISLIKKSAPDNIGFVFIHGLNPFGFQNQRRTNENNVDLNRNFVVDQAIFSGKNSTYQKISSFLNPQEPLEINIFSRPEFIFQSIRLIWQSSLETLRVGILEGQYEFPKGLYYGGQEYQPQKVFIDTILNQKSADYSEVFVIDLHTGYGQRGRLHFLAGSSTDPQSEKLKKIFEENSVDFSDQKNFYRTHGDLVSYIVNQSINQHHKKASGITFEFGTLDSQKTLGSIESLRRMVMENQVWWNGAADEISKSKVQNLFTEMFYPSDTDWRKQALHQAEISWNRVLNYFSESQ